MGEVNYTEKEVTTVSQLIPLVQKLACRFRRDSWSAADRDDIRQEGLSALSRRPVVSRSRVQPAHVRRTPGGRHDDGYVGALCRKSVTFDRIPWNAASTRPPD